MLDPRENEDGEVINVVLLVRLFRDTKQQSDLLRHETGVVADHPLGRRRTRACLFLQNTIEHAIFPRWICDTPEMAFTLSDLHPGEIAWLGGLQRPDGVGVVGFKVPEGCGAEVDAGRPDGIALGRRDGTGEETLVLRCGVRPVA